MKVKIHILTPVHIGSGEQISSIEYMLQNNKFIKLNMNALFESEEFKPFMEKFINSSGIAITDIVKDIDLRRYASYQLDMHSSARNYLFQRTPHIKAFIKSAGRVYIPGSSLKGAILSALAYNKGREKGIRRERELKELVSFTIAEASRSPRKDRFSRWLDVEDTDFKLPEECLQVILVQIIGARRHLPPILYEALKEGVTFTTRLKSSINHIYKFGALTEEQILKAADEFYRELYNKERTSHIRQTLPPLPKDGYLLRIGQGAGRFATSFLLLKEKLNITEYRIRRSKTRKLAQGFVSLGWIKIKPV
jgi:CRISPR type III-A-associated RAMP protein Csm5